MRLAWRVYTSEQTYIMLDLKTYIRYVKLVHFLKFLEWKKKEDKLILKTSTQIRGCKGCVYSSDIALGSYLSVSWWREWLIQFGNLFILIKESIILQFVPNKFVPRNMITMIFLLFIDSADVSRLQTLLWKLKDLCAEELKPGTRLSLKLRCKI